jgi:hypothetical protein
MGESTSYLPSLVGLDGTGAMKVAEDAEHLSVERVRRSIKRSITLNETEVSLPDGTTLEVDKAIRGILSELALRARRDGVELSTDTTRLGCPAMWTGGQRWRLLNLASESGLPIADHTLVDEPVAAGVAWVKHQMTLRRRELIGKLLVFDMGGGTLDVALLDVHAEPAQVPEISVLSSWGLDEAGDRLDEAIAEDLARQLTAHGVASDQLQLWAGLILDAARQAKLQLSHSQDALVALRVPGIDLPSITYTREELEEALAPQLGRAIDLVWAVLRGARVTHEVRLSPAAIRGMSRDELAMDVDHVLLAGGMSRVPAVARAVEKVFPEAELYMDAGVAADEAIVAGLAETEAFERINLHRPPLDIVLEYVQAGSSVRVPVYDAYSPLYPAFFAMQRDVLYYEWRPPNGTLPRSGEARLGIYTPGGEPVRLELDGDVGAPSIALGHHSPAVIIRPNGEVLITDGKKHQTSFVVPRWPVIRGRDHAVLVAKRNAHRVAPTLDRSWMRDPLFLH